MILAYLASFIWTETSLTPSDRELTQRHVLHRQIKKSKIKLKKTKTTVKTAYTYGKVLYPFEIDMPIKKNKRKHK